MQWTVSLLGPFLKEKKANPHATLLTLQMNSVVDSLTLRDHFDMNTRLDRVVVQYIRPPASSDGLFGLLTMKIVCAQCILMPTEAFGQR